ncbi:ribosomal protein L1 [Denitrovibrio acetiphilus DSM 12809]|uniref:Large ribosomal subunit protein uL1 n=1 Tax=Denitrovibrio acetiphilus (strain DSM 12809 / NBRC 114555 / N2460) TaxID=522772 RepID=D4H378_DENA2|nr:ribosomal protein L1 [Denitrovibrio acetiphilus DSM 12809]
MARGKQYQAASGKIDSEKSYNLEEAIALAKEAAFAKFDETIDIAVKLGVNPKHADQMVRGSVSLPHGTGRDVKVLVFCKGDKQKDAQDAGADFVGDDELIARVQDGWTDFDKVVATPDMMAQVGKLGKVLGPRGLMPNPKVGTVTQDVAKVVKELKAGMIEFRVDKVGIIHSVVGKKSFEDGKLKDNITALLDTLVKLKPASAKGQYVRGIYISATMGPRVKLDHSKIVNEL